MLATLRASRPDPPMASNLDLSHTPFPRGHHSDNSDTECNVSSSLELLTMQDLPGPSVPADPMEVEPSLSDPVMEPSPHEPVPLKLSYPDVVEPAQRSPLSQDALKANLASLLSQRENVDQQISSLQEKLGILPEVKCPRPDCQAKEERLKELEVFFQNSPIKTRMKCSKRQVFLKSESRVYGKI